MVKRLGAVSAGGIERRRVVDVPRERMASPGVERATTVAGLSPVKGAIWHSTPVVSSCAESSEEHGSPALKPQRCTQ